MAYDKKKTADYPGAPVSAKLVKERWEKARKAMRREQWDYIVNRSFLNGDQWVRWDQARNSLAQYPRDPSRVRATINRLWPSSRHLIAKLLSRELVFEVPPADSDDATVRGAHTAEAVIADLHREHNWEDGREQLAWSTWLGGTAVAALDWDAEAGPTLGHLPISGRPFGTGEVKESWLTVLEVGWEPGIRDAERALWWIRAQALPPCDVASMYDLKEEPAADASAAQGYMGRSVLREDRAETPVDLTLVLTMYERPHAKKPQGCVATVVGNEIVDGPHEWPFPWKDRLNMVVFRETKVAGRATGDTVFSAAVPIQTAYNASWSNIIEHLKLSGNARLMIPDASLDGIDELSDLPAEIVPYNVAGGKPEWLTPPNMPPWVMQQPAMLAQQMDDIMGLHDVSRGVAPTNVESGVGIATLVEQDSTPVGGLTREIAHGFERFASLVLRLYENKVTETRKARIRVPGEIPEVVSWTGKSLAGQTVVDIPMDAVMPRSRAAMLAFAERMLTIGVLPKDRPDVFARIADLPEQGHLLEGIDIDAAKALRENRLMAIGQVPIPAAFDNHATHVARHNHFRKSARYESMDAETRELIDLHIQGHETMAAEEMGTQVAKAMVNPALAAVPTGNEAAPLPEGMAPLGAEGGPAVDQQPGAPSPVAPEAPVI